MRPALVRGGARGCGHRAAGRRREHRTANRTSCVMERVRLPPEAEAIGLKARRFTPRPPNGAADFGPEPDTEPDRQRIRAIPFRWRDPQAIPPRRWLYARHYVRKFVTATVAPGGLGKSS